MLESFGLRAPAALRGAPGTASMRRSGVQPDKGKSRRLSLQAEAFCARVMLAYAPLPHSAVRQGS